MSRWPDDPYGKTLDDLDRKRTEVRNLKGKLRAERQKREKHEALCWKVTGETIRAERQQWEEERALWREFTRFLEECVVYGRIDKSTYSAYHRILGLEERDG